MNLAEALTLADPAAISAQVTQALTAWQARHRAALTWLQQWDGDKASTDLAYYHQREVDTAQAATTILRQYLTTLPREHRQPHRPSEFTKAPVTDRQYLV
jgi:hypothetical protein